MIYAKNISDKVVKVAISNWSGEEDDDEYVDINTGEVVQWDRVDRRGFLMSVVFEGEAPMLYSIRLNSYMTIDYNNIKNNGERISPL
ncbi:MULTISPECIES: hypothetical protein [Photorhabdus]|uniref:hypothetical protein n=1 Tax=Photorhabdus TaxID=29487 RepID=UPI0015624C79|nr:hypothetical protein [Photorhabdus heterorhabditis]NRN27722.1 hypothetical protein [Photorhabdus heterorhabditis subsp. aluminescens]